MVVSVHDFPVYYTLQVESRNSEKTGSVAAHRHSNPVSSRSEIPAPLSEVTPETPCLLGTLEL